tara:strand:- start:3519 stop:3899 length:381 start_codon:yes stop_codon:yes gene_type:complete
MWSGTDAAVPTNWALCDGTGGTPNLVDRFVVGRGSAYAADEALGSADAVVVSHNHTITDPGHAHTQSGGTTNDDGGAHVPGSTAAGGAMTNINNNTTGISIVAQGVSGTGKNLPPYYAIAYIMRIT